MFVAGFFDTEETSHTFRRVIENTFVNVSFGAPWLVGATVAAIVIAVVRGRARRRPPPPLTRRAADRPALPS